MNKRYRWYIALAFLIYGLDRYTKAVMLTVKKYYVTSWLHLSISFNRGISWGLFNSSQTLPFVLISIVIYLFISVFFVYTLMRYRHKKSIIGETLILAGSFSNFVDRLTWHGVLDFIIFSYGSWQWPSFNCADAAIVIGALIMIITTFWESDEKD